jgi:hypothetical protein
VNFWGRVKKTLDRPLQFFALAWIKASSDCRST